MEIRYLRPKENISGRLLNCKTMKSLYVESYGDGGSSCKMKRGHVGGGGAHTFAGRGKAIDMEEMTCEAT